MTILALVFALVGGCWACRASCLAMFPPPTVEEVARNQEMAERIAKTQRGDLVIVPHWGEVFDEKRYTIAVVIERRRDWVFLANLYCNHASGLPEGLAPSVTEVIFQNDPRWLEYRDRMIFGESATSQPTTQPATN